MSQKAMACLRLATGKAMKTEEMDGTRLRS